jgi:hypothetical protein
VKELYNSKFDVNSFDFDFFFISCPPLVKDGACAWFLAKSCCSVSDYYSLRI